MGRRFMGFIVSFLVEFAVDIVDTRGVKHWWVNTAVADGGLLSLLSQSRPR